MYKGPDLEWVQPQPGADEDDESTPWWEASLRPEMDSAKFQMMYEEITRYLPGIRQDLLRESYVGIRPKTVGPGIVTRHAAGWEVFLIRCFRVWLQGFRNSGRCRERYGRQGRWQDDQFARYGYSTTPAHLD